MEPRPYGRGDMIQPHSAGQTASASMEPRPYGRGDPSHFPGQMRSARLQWSHGHTAVETRPGRRGRSRGGASFNGATAIRSWRRETPHANDRHDQLASMEPRPYGRGDEGRASRAGGAVNASMEPRPYGRGDLRDAATNWARSVLASMEPRPYGRGDGLSRAKRRSRSWRFNGATAIRPWRHYSAQSCYTARNASMEPRPYGRGDGVPFLVVFQVPTCFNGATAIRPWRPGAGAGIRP